MSVRRQMFVVLISAIYATMDSMQAYNKSVNMVINKSEISDIENILKQALSEHNVFIIYLRIISVNTGMFSRRYLFFADVLAQHQQAPSPHKQQLVHCSKALQHQIL